MILEIGSSSKSLFGVGSVDQALDVAAPAGYWPVLSAAHVASPGPPVAPDLEVPNQYSQIFSRSKPDFGFQPNDFNVSNNKSLEIPEDKFSSLTLWLFKLSM